MKKIISLITSIVLMFSIGADTFAAYTEDRARAYETGDCTVTYTVQNEWDGNRQISMTVTNNGSETLRNWALKFDNTGEIADIWNASVALNKDGLCVIKNNGYNYEIIPDGSVEFGFQLRGDELALPESVAMCNMTVDSTEDAEISYEIRDNWGDGFIAEVSVTNNSDVPFEAWRLAFDGNFEISNIWNVNKLYTENGFLVENNVATVPIASGETKSFGFQGVIASGETPELSDFILTSIVVDLDSDLPVEPDKPVNPENPEHIIMCFGEYIEEDKSLEVYWYSTDEGEVSLYENTDNGGWAMLAENIESDSYKYVIGEDFLIKYIKAVQETENGTLESEPFIVALTEDGYVCTWLDSDNDGLPDYAEKAYGTDHNNPDTDGDGLTDYEEIYITGTNPLKYDTDENGTNDADDDLDGDGLSNKEEIVLGTSPSSSDTDSDGLSDYDEINKYNTDPLKADSDEDTLSDGDEIAIGLDPNDPETFGVPDAEYKVEQTIPADSEAMSRVNTEEAPYELSLELSASGNAAKHLIAGGSIYSNITESDARLGGAVGLNYFGGEVEKVKLIYEINDEYISNEGSEYAENCLDLQGIKRYNIFRYFEDLNMLLPIVTEFDEDNNILYAETDQLGTYCVMDMEILMQNLGIDSNGLRTEIVSRQAFSSTSIDVSGTTSDSYSVTFIFDVRKEIITANRLDSMKKAVRDFAEEAVGKGHNVTIRLISQDGTDFFNTSYKVYDRIRTLFELDKALNNITLSKKDILLGNNFSITDALNYVINAEGIYSNSYVFDMYSQTNAVFNNSYVKRLNADAQNKKINISIISDSPAVHSGYQGALAKSTDGLILYDYKNLDGHLIFDHIFDDVKYDAILLTGYETIQLNAQLNSKNNMDSDYVECAEDDDLHTNDHLTDWEEVGVDHWVKVGLMSVDESGNAKLPTIKECMDFTGLSYVEKGLERYKQTLGINFDVAIYSVRVLPIISDPTRADSDGDGIVDKYDPNPLIQGDKDTPCLYNSSVVGVENHRFVTDCIINVDGVGKTYMCLNCQTEPLLSPEAEDAFVLDNDNYVLVKMLLAVFKFLQNSSADASAEAVYATIEKIRATYGKGKYSYSYADGSYASPVEYTHLTEENDYSIICNFLDATETNRKLELYGEISWSILKPTIDAAFLYEPAGKVGMILITAGAFIWSFVSEGISSALEDRSYDMSSVLTSCALTVADLFLDRGNILSAMNITLSYANKYGVCQYVNNNKNAYLPDKDYHFDITIKSSKGEQYFYTKTDNAFIHSGFEFHVCDKNHKNSNAENYCQSSDNFDHLNGLVSYVPTEYGTPKKQMYKNMVMIPNVSIPLSLIGEYHYELDTSTNDFVWKKVWG